MAERESLKLLEAALDDQVAGFDSSRRFYRLSHYRLTIVTALFSSLTTVLIGADRFVGWPWWNILPLTLSACVTVAAAYDAFLKPKELWTQKTDAWMALQNLRGNLDYQKARNAELSQKEIDLFYERFNTIIMREHELWMTVRTSRSIVAKRASRKDAAGKVTP